MFAHRIYTRHLESRKIREDAADQASRRSHPDHCNNGEESEYHDSIGNLTYIANFSKGLPHNSCGEVDPAAYRLLLKAMYSKNVSDFERILIGTANGRKLVNPQAGFAFDLQGPDAQSVAIPPAPRIDSAESAGEIGEVYWMALLRDIPFHEYATHADVAEAAQSLSGPAAGGQFSDFRGPKDAASGKVTPETLFRGFTKGDLVGPYLSQFLLKPITFGTLHIPQRMRTAPAGKDFLTNFDTWKAVQNGANVAAGPLAAPPAQYYIRNLRDLATYVHFDALYEAYLNACLILLEMKAPFDSGNPYVAAGNQEGFGTFGGPHILSLVTEVATRALKAVWYQKWGVHRRLRPEEFGGRIHVHLFENTGRYPMISAEILDTTAGSVLDRVRNHNSQWGDHSYLLPQAFAEGAPTHPAYGAGHATVAGACVTILKAWFDESFVLPEPQIPDPVTGETLVAAPADTPPLTIGGELNKLAANISLGRNAGGVHWRSDYTQSVKLGEEIAIRILQEQKATYNEDHYLTLTKFDGTTIVI